MIAALKAVYEGKLALEQPMTMQAKYRLDGAMPLAMARVSRDGEALHISFQKDRNHNFPHIQS
jgi:hypothetical protein